MTPRTVSALQGVWCLLRPIVWNSVLPARLLAQRLRGWRGAVASWPELPSHSGRPRACGGRRRQTTGSFPRLLIAKPRERMTATAAALARSWQMVLSLFLLISNVMTFPFKNTDVARAATGAPLWEEHNVCCCSHSPLCICSYLRRRFHALTVLSRSSGSRWNLCLG